MIACGSVDLQSCRRAGAQRADAQTTRAPTTHAVLSTVGVFIFEDGFLGVFVPSFEPHIFVVVDILKGGLIYYNPT